MLNFHVQHLDTLVGQQGIIILYQKTSHHNVSEYSETLV